MNLVNRLVYKNLRLNKKRTIVTIIGIILSASLLVALTSLVASFRQSLISYERARTGNYHYSFENVNSQELDAIENNQKIDFYFQVKEEGYASLPESENESKPYLRLVSTDQTGLENMGVKLRSGRLPQNDTEVVIPRHLQTNGRVKYSIGDVLDLDMGERISLEKDSLGQTIDQHYPYQENAEELENTSHKQYTVVGFMERLPYAMEDFECPGYTMVTYSKDLSGAQSVYVRLTKAGLKDDYTVVANILGVDSQLFAKNNDPDEPVSEEDMKAYLVAMEKVNCTMNRNSWLISYERVWPLESTIRPLFIIAMVVVIIIVLTSVYCIKNSFDISISEKIRQYGMLSSIGATKKQIRKSVHFEAAIMGLIGIPLGVIFGNLAGVILIRLSNYLLRDSLNIGLVYAPSVAATVIAVLFAIVTVYFSAMGSARSAGRITPMEAIRNQKEITLKKNKLKTPKLISKIWGIGGVISYKNIKRNRKKYRTTTVSIVICTVTFIVVSYFMSMLFSTISLSYDTDKANVVAYVESVEDYDKLESDIGSLENIDDFNILKDGVFYNRNIPLTKDFEDYTDELQVDELGKNQIIVSGVSDKTFQELARENGIKAEDGVGILVNKVVYEIDTDQVREKGEVNTFDCKAGDVMEVSDVTYEDEDTDNAEAEDSGEEDFTYGPVHSIKIGAIMEDRILGTMNSTSYSFLYVSMSTFDSIGETEGIRPFVNIVTSKADTVQSDIEKLFNSDQNVSDYSVNNKDANTKTVQQFYLLVGIFAYGLIIVIALIGITNIINTLGTSMELRSREFATLRSVGMTNSQFSRMVRLESLFTAGKSLIIGNAVGLIISYGLNRFMSQMDTVIIYQPPVKACILTIVVVMILIYAIIRSSMNRIMKKNIIETIKNENL